MCSNPTIISVIIKHFFKNMKISFRKGGGGWGPGGGGVGASNITLCLHRVVCFYFVVLSLCGYQYLQRSTLYGIPFYFYDYLPLQFRKF